jgi:hypothetical protein
MLSSGTMCCILFPCVGNLCSRCYFYFHYLVQENHRPRLGHRLVQLDMWLLCCCLPLQREDIFFATLGEGYSKGRELEATSAGSKGEGEDGRDGQGVGGLETGGKGSTPNLLPSK